MPARTKEGYPYYDGGEPSETGMAIHDAMMNELKSAFVN
ncbi:unnamed protein product, partial [marine sediment metagenome]